MTCKHLQLHWLEPSKLHCCGREAAPAHTTFQQKNVVSANAIAFWREVIFVAKWDMIWEILLGLDTKETKMDIDQIAQSKKNWMIQTMQTARDL